ncbi:hypothetical protein B0H16DRAFT_1733744 [Mycena metata]|uniref:Uncharacterized protein n=1 Tax=Mycena metata TaxID=1033252 RepID=A0AAD7HZ05_9AGAR|nr:hypothetical protein B0H16DRAFT_1742969 [Mycena metata]KAJ7730588.1 hypothetical protein B0H16DRAFT_1733744 [Mycena metata]
MAARCNLVRPPPDWRSSQGSSRFLCSFQADSDSDASKIFRAYDGIPHAHPSSRGSSHGVVVGSGLFDSDTQHARARARGQQCANLVLTLARPVDNDLRPGESLARSERLPPPKRCLTHHRSSIVLANPSVFTLIRGTVSDPLLTRCPSFTWYCPRAAPFAPAVSTPPSRIHGLHPLASGGLGGSSSSPAARSLHYDVCGDPPSLPLPQARSSLSRNFDLPDVPRARPLPG